MRHEEVITIPGALCLRIEFDPQTFTESGCDELHFYREEGRNDELRCFSGRRFKNFEIMGDTVYLYFYSDSSCVEWGYKFTVIPEMPPKAKGKLKLNFEADPEYALWVLQNIEDE